MTLLDWIIVLLGGDLPVDMSYMWDGTLDIDQEVEV